MTQIDEILNKIVEVLETYPALSAVKKWYKVDGMIPAAHPCGSVSPIQEDFDRIAKLPDRYRSTIRFTIFVYLQHADPEGGEQQIRELSHNVRLALDTEKLNKINGVMDRDVYGIKYMTVDASSTLLLHAAEINFQVKYLLD